MTPDPDDGSTTDDAHWRDTPDYDLLTAELGDPRAPHAPPTPAPAAS